MPSSTSSSNQPDTDPLSTELASAERLTASDRPGVAQPVPERPVPAQPWRAVLWFVAIAVMVLVIAWEWNARRLGLQPGDVDDSASAWAEQRRRVDANTAAVAIVGDSRILFDTDLEHFEKLTGTRPVQLALPGTNARPFLENLANDASFKGLAIVGIAELSYFRDGIGLMADALDRYAFESPSQRSSFQLHGTLSQFFGFLDAAYRLSTLVHRIDPGWRAGTRGPYNDVWKISVRGTGRQTWLWSRIETDKYLRDHARGVWMGGGMSGPPVADDVIARTLSATRAAVRKIRARGGDVVFIRPPSSDELRMLEEKRLPRAKGWDALIAAVEVEGIHFDDEPSLQGLSIPEMSHLSRAFAKVFTDAYVRILAARMPRIAIRPDAPAPLTATDC